MKPLKFHAFYRLCLSVHTDNTAYHWTLSSAESSPHPNTLLLSLWFYSYLLTYAHIS